MTNYFLPWLTLTAQLPFETGDPWSNVMSFCLALGSPSLITFSLTITILNRLWVRQQFARLTSRTSDWGLFRDYEHRVQYVQYLLQEAQQVPLRASQEHGWLSSLIVIPDNANWWKLLKGRLRSTRRGFTASLVAQMALAFVAYLFTVIASFLAYLGDPNTALQIASGSIWIWLVCTATIWPKLALGVILLQHILMCYLSDSCNFRVDYCWYANNSPLDRKCASCRECFLCERDIRRQRQSICRRGEAAGTDRAWWPQPPAHSRPRSRSSQNTRMVGGNCRRGRGDQGTNPQLCQGIHMVAACNNDARRP